MKIAYLRVSTDKQDIENQRHEISCRYDIDEWVEDVISGKKSAKSRKVLNLIRSLTKEDTLIVSEMSRIGRSMFDLNDIVRRCMEKDVTLIAIKEGLTIKNDLQSKITASVFAISAEIERQMISDRTKAALARKRDELRKIGKKLGRQKGTIMKHHKLDQHSDVIKEYLDNGYSYSKIANLLNVHYETVRKFVERTSK